MDENELSFKIIGAAISIHRTVGPGLLESAYETALVHDLSEMGLQIKQQVAMPFYYRNVKQNIGYRADILVNDKVIIEIKSVDALAPIHYSQTLTYLRVSDLKLALLINFNCVILKDGIHRIVNGL